MAQVPSTRWTVYDVLSSARELAKTVDQKKVVVEQGKYFYKIALSEIVTLLNSALDPSYYKEVGLTVISGSADISDINYDRIIGITDSNVGQCIEVSPIEFMSLHRTTFHHVSYDDDIVYCIIGNTIKFSVGKKVKDGAKIMSYQRQPDYPINYDDIEKVDLSDKHIPLLINKIYSLILLQTQPDIPQNLANEMQMLYQQITGFTQAENANKTKDERQIKIGNKQPQQQQ